MPPLTPSSPYFIRSRPHQEVSKMGVTTSSKEQKHERVRIKQECFSTTPTHQICHQLTLFLFLKVKEHLADTSQTQNHFTVTFPTEEVTAAYRR
jgi:hypothetical protein